MLNLSKLSRFPFRSLHLLKIEIMHRFTIQAFFFRPCMTSPWLLSEKRRVFNTD